MKSFTLIEKKPLMVIGIECRTSNAPDAGPVDIPRLWERFYSEGIAGQIPNSISEETVALYCDYEKDHLHGYTCVIGRLVSSLSEIPAGMVGKTIPGSNFARFPIQGAFPQNLIQTWQYIWQSDLKRSCTCDYELYPKEFTQDPEKKVEIYIAVD